MQHLVPPARNPCTQLAEGGLFGPRSLCCICCARRPIESTRAEATERATKACLEKERATTKAAAEDEKANLEQEKRDPVVLETAKEEKVQQEVTERVCRASVRAPIFVDGGNLRARPGENTGAKEGSRVVQDPRVNGTTLTWQAETLSCI